MKKLLITCLALAFVAVTMVSCNKNGPKDVATKWLTSFWQTDYETAKKYSTEETKTFLATMQSLSNMLPDSAKAEAKNIKVTVKDVTVEGDTTATAIYTTSSEPAKDQTLKLVKKDNIWLVQFTKNDDMGTEPEPESPDQSAVSDTAGAAPAAVDPPGDTARH